MDDQDKTDYLLGQVHGLACCFKALWPTLTQAQQQAMGQQLQVTWDLAVSRQVSDSYAKGLEEMGHELALWTPN